MVLECLPFPFSIGPIIEEALRTLFLFLFHFIFLFVVSWTLKNQSQVVLSLNKPS